MFGESRGGVPRSSARAGKTEVNVKGRLEQMEQLPSNVNRNKACVNLLQAVILYVIGIDDDASRPYSIWVRVVFEREVIDSHLVVNLWN